MCRRLIFLVPVVLILSLVLTNVTTAADADLIGWEMGDGLSELDEERENRGGWRVEVVAEAVIEW